jgi:large subunit ribosomal protein L4
MSSIILPIYSSAGKEVDKVSLDASVFDGKVNTKVLYLAANAFLANQRRGLAATKTRGEVSGGGRKPWRQKGTGRARVGSTRSPLWRHGGVIFGPHPRDFSWKLPQKIKALALRSSLNAKVKDNNLIVLEGLKFETAKTKEARKLFLNLNINGKKAKKETSVLLVAEKFTPEAKLALGNIGFLNVDSPAGVNAYAVISHAKVILTKDALQQLTKRLKNG